MRALLDELRHYILARLFGPEEDFSYESRTTMPGSFLARHDRWRAFGDLERA